MKELFNSGWQYLNHKGIVGFSAVLFGGLVALYFTVIHPLVNQIHFFSHY